MRTMNAARCLLIVACAAVVATGGTRAGESEIPALVPRPASIEVKPGAFPITDSTQILVRSRDARTQQVAEYLAQWLRPRTGFALPVRELQRGGDSMGHIILASAAMHGANPEAYHLMISPQRVGLFASDPRGLFLGVQTVRQLLPAELERFGRTGQGAAPHTQPSLRSDLSLPCLQIADEPRYKWRGMLLDCCRHFMSKAFVKRTIDLLALHKMNTLHWHLTEDQGWRIEIKRYPRLTEVGAWREATRDDEHPRDEQGRYGGFYSQDDVREIVAYAAARHVTIVPEIEMPGHSRAALAAYPELSCTGGPFEVSTKWGIREDIYCAGNEKTFEFLENVLSEVIELFPSQYIHIGGDEAPKTRWRACQKCQARIRDEGLKDEDELQSYFTRRIEKFLNSKGRRLIGWDEILEGGLAPNATVQSWRGMKGALAAARAGHDVISSPTTHCYLDYAQYLAPGQPTHMGYIPARRTYWFEPTPTELTPEQAAHVLGLEGNMWTEFAPQERVDWQVFPRLCALAEVGWTPKDERNWSDFSRRMKQHYRRLDALGVDYFTAPPQPTTEERVFTDEISVRLENPVGRGVMRYTLDEAEPTKMSDRYGDPIRLTETTMLKARTFFEDGRSTPVAEYVFRKMQPLEPIVVGDPQPGLAVEYYEGEWTSLPDFDARTPASTGNVDSVNALEPAREDRFAARFEGLFKAPADGIYTFYVNSDDGSRLCVHDQVIVENDGLHRAQEAEGQVILKAGLHPLRILYFQARGARTLEVHWKGPGSFRRPLSRADLRTQ